MTITKSLDDFILNGSLFGLKVGSPRSDVLSLFGKPSEWETVGGGSQNKCDQVPTSCMYWYGRLAIGFQDDSVKILALNYYARAGSNDTTFDHRLRTGEINFDHETTEQEFMALLAKCGASVRFHSSREEYSRVVVNDLVRVHFARHHRSVLEGDCIVPLPERYPERTISCIITSFDEQV